MLSSPLTQASEATDVEAGPAPAAAAAAAGGPGGGDEGMEAFFSEVAVVKGIMERIRRALAKLQASHEAGARARGLHSFTFKLNVSAFCGIGGAFRGCLGGDGGFRGC